MDPAGSPQSEIPSTIGRYRILERLSPARHDDVYKGFDPIIERHLVVKIFPFWNLDTSATAAVRQTFFEQMQRIGMLAHPGITTLFDAGETTGGLFMATEFVAGASLADHLEAGLTWPLTERVSLVAQLADALEYAREQGVLHLHLRPSNVLIDGDSTAKIRGVGIAGVQDALAPHSRADSGQREWAAPERLAGFPGDSRADVFSLARLANRILGDAAPRDTAAGLADVLRTACASQAGDRFDTIGAFKYALLLALGLDEVEVRIAWESTREAGNVLAADRGGSGLPHSNVGGDLTAMILETPTHLAPAAAEDVDTLMPSGGVSSDPDLTKPA